VQGECYRDALETSFADGKVSRDNSEALESLRLKFSIRPSDHEEILSSFQPSRT
jgi:hypothetical protein